MFIASWLFEWKFCPFGVFWGFPPPFAPRKQKKKNEAIEGGTTYYAEWINERTDVRNHCAHQAWKLERK